MGTRAAAVAIAVAVVTAAKIEIIETKFELNKNLTHLKMPRIITFNVNGIRSIRQKSKDGKKNTEQLHSTLVELLETEKPDVLCLQEVRSDNEKDLEWLGEYLPYQALNYSEIKKGYSGTAILSKTEPVKIHFDFTAIDPALIGDWTERPTAREGRMITCIWPEYVIVCVYTPNSGENLARLEERQVWDILFRNYIRQLQIRLMGRHVIICGDLNVAHTELDIHKAKGNELSAGFTIQERAGFDKLLKECKLFDSWRIRNPGLKSWSWWSNFHKCRERDVGWRIDYILLPEDLIVKLIRAEILKEYWGSDHAPCLTEWM